MGTPRSALGCCGPLPGCLPPPSRPLPPPHPSGAEQRLPPSPRKGVGETSLQRRGPEAGKTDRLQGVRSAQGPDTPRRGAPPIRPGGGFTCGAAEPPPNLP